MTDTANAPERISDDDLRKLLDECTKGPWDYHIGQSDWGMPRCNFITRAGDDPEPITGQVIAQVDAITPYCLGASAKDRKLSANANANARLIALAPDLAKDRLEHATHCDELVAAAYLDAARVPTSFLVGDPPNGIPFRSPMAHEVAEAIKARTPDNARATLTAYGERMKAEGAREAQAKIARLTEALKWYGEQARLCRLIHSEGDAGRNALNNDGGKRAAAALQENANE